MSNLSQVKVGSTTYDLRDFHKSGVYFVEGTHTATTNSWTGVLNGVDALYDGLTIAYYLPYGGEGAVTLNLTLNGSTATGPINCYVGTDRVSGQYTPGMIIYFTYCSAGSITVNGVSTTDNRWMAHASGGTAGEGAIAYIITKDNVNSVTVDGTIAADDITSWTTNYPTQVQAKTVVTTGSTTTITPVTKKTVVVAVTPATVVTGGSTTTITPVTAKTVVTSASGATASISQGVLTITNGSFSTGNSVNTGTAINAYTSLTTGAAATVSTGDSVTTGTAINAYTSLTTGDSVVVTPGTAATLSYTAKSVPNITVTPVSVVVELTPTGAMYPSVVQDPQTRGLVIS